MELEVKRRGNPARIEVDTTDKCLLIHHEGGEERVALFSTTRIEIKGARLIVGGEEFDPNLAVDRPPTVMDIQEFAKLLKQVAGSAGGSGASARPLPQANTTPTRPSATPQRPGTSANAEARSHLARAAGIATFVEVVGFVGAILSAIGGLVIAFNSDCDRFCDDYSLTERYPFLIEGITIGVFGAFSMLSIAMVAAYIRGRAAEKGL